MLEHQFSEDLFTEASLSDSVIYQTFNRNAEMTSTILSAIKNSVVIDSSYIEEQIIQMKRTRISPLVKEDNPVPPLFTANVPDVMFDALCS